MCSFCTCMILNCRRRDHTTFVKQFMKSSSQWCRFWQHTTAQPSARLIAAARSETTWMQFWGWFLAILVIGWIIRVKLRFPKKGDWSDDVGVAQWRMSSACSVIKEHLVIVTDYAMSHIAREPVGERLIAKLPPPVTMICSVSTTAGISLRNRRRSKEMVGSETEKGSNEGVTGLLIYFILLE